MDRFKILATVTILLIKDDQILLTRRANTGFFDGFYECPSGHIDGKETMKEAAIRELREEVGVHAKIDDMQVVHVVHRYGNEYERVELYLIAKKWEGEPAIKEPDRCDDLKWFQINQFPENMVPKTKAALESYLRGEIYSEFDWQRR